MRSIELGLTIGTCISLAAGCLFEVEDTAPDVAVSENALFTDATFRRSEIAVDHSEIVRAFDRPNHELPWKITMMQIGGVNINRLRWTFTAVGPDPSQPGWMRGTLQFDPAGLTSPAEFDQVLQQLWPTTSGEVTVDVTVSCNFKPRQMKVKLLP